MSTAVTGLVAAALTAAAVGLRGRAVRSGPESLLWSLVLLAVVAVSGPALAGAVLDGLAAGHPGLEGVGQVVFGFGCVIACGLLFYALNVWNRLRLQLNDSGVNLIGLSAVLALVAIGNLAVPHFRHPAPGLPQWQLQVSLWTGSSLFVVLGATMTIALMAGLLRDPRALLMIGGLSLVAAAEWTGLAVREPSRPLITTSWLLAAAFLLVAVRIGPRPDIEPMEPGTSQATVSGALVVLLSSVAVLAVDNDLALDGSRWPTVYALAGVVGASVRVVRLVQDLADLARSRRQAMTDELTGIANRRALMMAIDSALLTASCTSLLIIDLDRFKAINDRYGHEAGDQVLRHMTDTFAGLVPPDALLARLGGDEFAVLLTEPEPGEPERLAQSLAQAAAPLSDVKGRLLQVGASVGVATVDRPGVEGGELLRRADAAMYQAKTSGSGVRAYDEAVDAIAQERLGLVDDLHRALAGPTTDQEQIVVHFQPQLDTATGLVAGAEALVRWEHPRLGLLMPVSFIDLAEQNELMAALTARVMREAVLQAARWRLAGHPLRVSVNLSASCLGHHSLMGLIDDALAEGIPASDLVLEVTETSLMKDPEAALAAMNRMADRGVGISIDDYGTGYSSLSYMNDLPATELKIDRSFTARVTGDPRTAAIVAGTVELAHRLGMRLIAEGVEDEETLTAMARLGCDETQGYLHSRPLPAELFLAWLTTHDLTAAAPKESAAIG